MDGFNSHATGGSLQISSEVIEKIAKQAAMEVDGVAAVKVPALSAQSLLGKRAVNKPIHVEINNDVADIEVAMVVRYGVKIPEISEKVQENVKHSVQNMTSITVGRVNLIISGIASPMEAD